MVSAEENTFGNIELYMDNKAKKLNNKYNETFAAIFARTTAYSCGDITTLARTKNCTFLFFLVMIWIPFFLGNGCWSRSSTFYSQHYFRLSNRSLQFFVLHHVPPKKKLSFLFDHLI
jgi:hypothetical protein